MGRGPTLAIAGVILAYAALASAVAVLTPPWEANDEPDHVLNVQTIAAGRMYRIEPGSGIESHQAPLYYVVLAGWQRALGIEPWVPAGVPTGTNAQGVYRHDIPTDGAEHRRVVALRVPGIAFGILTLLVTAAIARLLTRDPWTPVVATAVAAGVPKFVVVSGVVNNDSLATLAGALTTLAALHLVIRRPASDRGRLIGCGVAGLCVGLAVLSKATAGAIALPAMVAAVAIAPGAAGALANLAALVLGTLLVAGQWLAYNLVTYGDPLAQRAQMAYLRSVLPGLFSDERYLVRFFTEVPRGIFRTFWYISGWNQFTWPDWAHFGFWATAAVSLSSWIQPREDAIRIPRAGLLVLVAAVLAGVAAIFAVGVFTTQVQGRIGFIGLPALAVLVALGLERWSAPVVLRFVLPAMGLIGTLVAIRQDIVGIYF